MLPFCERSEVHVQESRARSDTSQEACPSSWRDQGSEPPSARRQPQGAGPHATRGGCALILDDPELHDVVPGVREHVAIAVVGRDLAARARAVDPLVGRSEVDDLDPGAGEGSGW